jgi:hypothetical protein
MALGGCRHSASLHTGATYAQDVTETPGPPGAEPVAPSFREDAFNCPLCGAYARMGWTQLQTQSHMMPVWHARCGRCHESSYWLGQGRVTIRPPRSAS